jgi:hypothetical protein
MLTSMTMKLKVTTSRTWNYYNFTTSSLSELLWLPSARPELGYILTGITVGTRGPSPECQVILPTLTFDIKSICCKLQLISRAGCRFTLISEESVVNWPLNNTGVP